MSATTQGPGYKIMDASGDEKHFCRIDPKHSEHLTQPLTTAWKDFFAFDTYKDSSDGSAKDVWFPSQLETWQSLQEKSYTIPSSEFGLPFPKCALKVWSTLDGRHRRRKGVSDTDAEEVYGLWQKVADAHEVLSTMLVEDGYCCQP